MPRRPSSFAKALQDAEKRLEKALVERKESLDRVAALAIEIPSLERTIWALKQQMNPSEVTFEPKAYVPTEGAMPADRVVYVDSRTGLETPPRGLSPMEMAKWQADRDLSNVGSVPAKQLSEDELLPDPEGDALTEE